MRADPFALGRAKPPAVRFTNAHQTKRLTPAERHAALTEQTGKWVAQTFFGQMLKQMRDSPFKSKLFDGGRGGAAFQEMADQRLADGMARGAGHRLVDNIVRHIEGRAAYAAQSKAARRPAVAGHNRGVA